LSSTKVLFISNPSRSGLQKLKHAKLLEVADHYKITCSSSAKKEDIRHGVLEYLLEEKIISENEGEGTLSASSAALELEKLQFEKNERVRENALRIKELELKEKELALLMELKEFETKALSSTESVSKFTGLDISKHVCLFPRVGNR